MNVNKDAGRKRYNKGTSSQQTGENDKKELIISFVISPSLLQNSFPVAFKCHTDQRILQILIYMYIYIYILGYNETQTFSTLHLIFQL